MSRDQQVYGITTSVLTAGVSTVVGLSPALAGIIDRQIVGMTGAGLLYAAGFSGANNGSLVAAGGFVHTTALPLSLGAAPVYFTTTGGPVVISILTKLGQGFNASSQLSP